MSFNSVFSTNILSTNISLKSAPLEPQKIETVETRVAAATLSTIPEEKGLPKAKRRKIEPKEQSTQKKATTHPYTHLIFYEIEKFSSLEELEKTLLAPPLKLAESIVDLTTTRALSGKETVSCSEKKRPKHKELRTKTSHKKALTLENSLNSPLAITSNLKSIFSDSFPNSTSPIPESFSETSEEDVSTSSSSSLNILDLQYLFEPLHPLNEIAPPSQISQPTPGEYGMLMESLYSEAQPKQNNRKRTRHLDVLKV